MLALVLLDRVWELREVERGSSPRLKSLSVVVLVVAR
jgi:hypothetical protein